MFYDTCPTVHRFSAKSKKTSKCLNIILKNVDDVLIYGTCLHTTIEYSHLFFLYRKWGMCQRDNNPTKEWKTSGGHQSVFNKAKKIPHLETFFS